MIKYLDFSVNNLILDDNFCQYVLEPDALSKSMWDSFLRKHPEMQETHDLARQSILKLHKASSNPLTNELLSASWTNIQEELQYQQNKQFIKKIGINTMFVFLFLTCCYFIFKLTESEPILTAEDNWIEYTNNTDAVWRIDLLDGSVVTLEPNSYLKYPQSFEGSSRKVTLKGEGFFDIARDTAHPFFVYAQDAVIRVLGTSFFVKAQDDDKDVEVIVRTGKVAVYKRSELKKINQVSVKKIRPVFVTPNQKVVLNKLSQKMSRRLTSTPTLVKPLSKLKKFRFESRPVREIFDSLEEAYGVEIQTLNKELKNCLLTTTLTEQTLFEKLDIICEPLGLEYYEADAKIIIKGNCL